MVFISCVIYVYIVYNICARLIVFRAIIYTGSFLQNLLHIITSKSVQTTWLISTENKVDCNWPSETPSLKSHVLGP